MSQCDFHRERGETARATTRVVVECPDKPRTQHLCGECVETYSDSIIADYGPIDPRDVPVADRTRTLNRFIEKIDFPDDDQLVEECWTWKRSKRNEYAQFWWAGQARYGHRYAFAAVYGYLPAEEDPEELMHECANRGCVNPSHLWTGTSSQNRSHATETTGVGPDKEISEVEEEEIKSRYDEGDVTQSELGEEYGVVRSVISEITNGEYR